MNEIGKFPAYSALDLNLKNDFFRAYEFSQPGSADMVFNTLFAWRDYFNYRVSKLFGFLIVYYVASCRMTVLMPLQAEKLDHGRFGTLFLELAKILSGYCEKNGLILEFSGITESCLKNIPAGEFLVLDDRDNYDYVYRRTDLSALEGRAYAQKRNLIRQFENKYTWNYEILDEKNLTACRRFIEEWDVAAARNGILGVGAYCMACRLLENFDSLGVCGGLLYADGKIVAATVASLADNFLYENGIFPTAVVHHENGLTDHKGVYQMINRMFAINLPEHIVYINREEDMGLEGLRKAKLSYNPALLIKKYKLKFSNEKLRS
jgi:uncharacterized protein